MRGLWVMLLVACGGKSDGDTAPAATEADGPVSACGEVTNGLSVQVQGVVHLQGAPVAGAEVALTEGNWEPGTVHGTAVTGADGTFVLDATELVSVEDCWGTALDYAAEATFDTWERSVDMNAPLFAAIIGDGVADVRGNPIELDASWIPPVDTGG